MDGLMRGIVWMAAAIFAFGMAGGMAVSGKAMWAMDAYGVAGLCTLGLAVSTIRSLRK